MRAALLTALYSVVSGICWWDGSICDCTVNCATLCTDPNHCDRPNCHNTGVPNCCQCNYNFYPSGLSCLSCPNRCPWLVRYDCECTCSGCNKCQGNASTCVGAGCGATCKTCIDLSADCHTCHSHSSVDGGVCVCDLGYFGIAPLCQTCNSSCKKCSTTADNCTECYGLAILSVGICTCPTGCNTNPMNCELCDSSCATCAASGVNQCLSCVPTFSLADDPPSKCLCPFGTYLSAVPSCLPCHSYCLTCSGPTASLCLSCNYGALLAGLPPNSCTCLPPATASSSPDQCSTCASTCLSCANDSDTGCVTCYNHALVKYPPGSCECISGFFPNTNVANCQSCNSVCLSCVGPGEDHCTSCKPNAVLQGSQCICTGSYQPYPDASNCVFIPPAPPEDQPPIPPLTAVLQVLSNNSLVLVFNSTLKSELHTSELTIQVSDLSEGNLAVQWNFSPLISALSYGFSLSFPEALPGNNSQVILGFPTPSDIQSTLGGQLDVSMLTGLLHPLPTQTVGISLNSSAATTAAAASKTALATTTLSSVFSGSPSSFWSLLNQLQLITYIPLSTLPLPARFASTLAALNVNSFLTNPFSYVFHADNCTQVPDFAENYGVDTSLLLLNAGIMLTAAASCLISYLQVYLLSKCGLDWLQTYFARLLGSFRWGIFLRYWLQVYLDVALYSLLQISSLKGLNCLLHTGFLVNFALACTCTAVCLLTPFLLVLFSHRNSQKCQDRSDFDFNLAWGVLFLDLNSAYSPSALLYYAIFFFRRLILAVTLIFLSDYTGAQAFIMVFLQVFVRNKQIFGYVVLARPFRERLDQCTAVVTEIGNSVIFLAAGLYAFDLGATLSADIEAMAVITVLGAIVASAGLSLVRTILTVAELFRLYQSKTNRLRVKATFQNTEKVKARPRVQLLD